MGKGCARIHERTRRTIAVFALLLLLLGALTFLLWWDSHSQTLQLVWRRRLYRDPWLAVYSLAFSPDGAILAVGGFSEIQLWRTIDGRPIKVLKRPPIRFKGTTIFAGSTNTLAFSPDGKWLAAGDSVDNDNITLWSLPEGMLRFTLSGHEDDTCSLLFSPDGKFLFSAGEDGWIKVWRVSDWKLERSWQAHQKFIYSMALSPSGRWLASTSKDGTVKLSNLDGSLVRIWQGFRNGAFRVAFSSDEQWLATSAGDGTVKIWSIADGSLMSTFKTSKFPRLATSPQSPLLAVGHYSVEIRRMPDGQLMNKRGLGQWFFRRWFPITLLGRTWHLPDPLSLSREFHFVYGGLAFSPDGKFLAVGDTGANVWLFRVKEP
ncbi:MAG: WD40 repeat domain-containing protein [Armatimonadota bacterium]